MKYAIVAHDIANQENDSYWCAKCAELIGDIFNETYNYPQALKYTRQAAEKYRQAGKIANHRYALCDIATRYINMEESEKALTIIDSIRSVLKAEIPFDTSLDNYAIDIEMAAMQRLGRNEELTALMSQYTCDSTATANLSEAILNTYIYANSEDSTSMDQSLFRAFALSESAQDSVCVLYASYSSALRLGRYQDAALLADSLIVMQSHIAKNILYESTSAIPKDYYANQTFYQRQRAKILQLIIIGVIVMACIATTLLWLLYRQRLNAKRAELESNLAIMLQYKESANTNKNNIESLLQERCSMLATLCDEYFELGQTPKARARILGKVDAALYALRDPETVKQLEQSTDAYIGGIIQATREQCSFLNEKELQMISLILTKHPSRTICVILNIKYKNFYLRKSRIVKKIAASNIPVRDELLHRLGR